MIRRDHLREEMERLIKEDGGHVDQDEISDLIETTQVHTFDLISCPLDEGDMSAIRLKLEEADRKLELKAQKGTKS